MSLWDELYGTKPVTSLDQQRLAMPEAKKPEDFASFSLSGPQQGDRVSVKPPTAGAGYAAAIQGGLNAGQSSGAGQAYDGTEAAVSIGSSMVAGAAAGALAGSAVPVVGTVVGGLVGAGVAGLTAGAQAWMSLRAKKRRKRELEALRREAQEREERLKAEQAADKAYERKKNALAGAAEAYERNNQNMLRLIANNKEALRFFVREGI